MTAPCRGWPVQEKVGDLTMAHEPNHPPHMFGDEATFAFFAGRTRTKFTTGGA